MTATMTMGSELKAALIKSALPGQAWYVVLDAAQNKDAPKRAAESGLHTQSLYAGALGARLADVAPHLAMLDLQGRFADWLFAHWADALGILLQSNAAFHDVRRHLRKFLLVKDEAGRKFRLRYYDPRVLRHFLPACTPDELATFFGPIACYYAAGRSGRGALAYTFAKKKLRMTQLGLGAVASDVARQERGS